MRVTIQQEVLDEGLRTVGRAVSTRNTIPVLSGISLQAEDGWLRLRATDLERSVATAVEAEVHQPGALVLPGRSLLELARRLPPGRVEIVADLANSTARLACDEVAFTMHGFPADQFPQEAAELGQGGVTMTAGELRRLLRETGFATSHDESKPWFTGVYLAVQGDRAVAMATDAAVVAYGEVPVSNVRDVAFSVILPGPTVQELGRQLSAGAERCELFLIHNQMRFGLGGVTVTSRLLEGQYPDFRRVMPTQFPSRLRLSRPRLLEALDRAALMAKDSEIRLEGKPGTLHLSARTPEVGRVEERVPAEQDGPPFETGLNVRYLLEGLRAMEGPEVLVEYAGPRSPVRFRTAPGEAAFFAVMPLLTF